MWKSSQAEKNVARNDLIEPSLLPDGDQLAVQWHVVSLGILATDRYLEHVHAVWLFA